MRRFGESAGAYPRVALNAFIDGTFKMAGFQAGVRQNRVYSVGGLVAGL